MADSKIVVFQDKQIRRVWVDDDWYFSIVDIVGVLTGSPEPRKYWNKVKTREFTDLQLSPIWRQLKLPAADGKQYRTDCATTHAMFRIIQSIPSPKAEPFKQWLAQVGYERVQEIENPELAQERMKAIYEAKGYPKDWIDKRLRGIAIRQNLNDHMTDLELIFTMLGERVTTEISQQEKPDTFAESKQVARRGGNVAGVARRETERELGHSVVSGQNFLDRNPDGLIEDTIGLPPLDSEKE
mgnify:CR=1 FL=1